MKDALRTHRTSCQESKQAPGLPITLAQRNSQNTLLSGSRIFYYLDRIARGTSKMTGTEAAFGEAALMIEARALNV